MVVINVTEETRRTIDAIRFELIGMTRDELYAFLTNIKKECDYWLDIVVDKIDDEEPTSEEIAKKERQAGA